MLHAIILKLSLNLYAHYLIKIEKLVWLWSIKCGS